MFSLEDCLLSEEMGFVPVIHMQKNDLDFTIR